MQKMLDDLRDDYMKYNETVQRCQTELRSGQNEHSGEQFRNFYFKPKIPLLEKPEDQKRFRERFIEDVGRIPKPEPLYLIADQLHLDELQTIGDRSNPHETRQELAKFYKRRTAQLQHRRYKLMHRWANSQITAGQVDATAATFDKCLGHLQLELDGCIGRMQRLQPDDQYLGADTVQRPQPTANKSKKASSSDSNAADGDAAPLYMESKSKSINSAIRLDDFEVFLRIRTYQDKINRVAKKLVQEIKWIPYSSKFEIWADSRIYISDAKKNYKDKSFQLYNHICKEIKDKMDMIGYSGDDKVQKAVTDRYTYHLKGSDLFISRQDQMLQSHICNHDSPPMLFASNIELKLKLQELAKEYNLDCTQLDMDKGQQFTYQLQTFFPTQFQIQLTKLQFDWEDTGKNADKLLLEKLTTNLGLNKVELLEQMAKYSAEQRQNSILGCLNFDKTTGTGDDESGIKSSRQDSLGNEQDKKFDQFSKHNLLKKIQAVEFFKLDETGTRLRKADWLDLICFSPNISQIQKKQNNVLSNSTNEIDNLLRSAFEFTDVNDSASVNKILEDASQAHIQKVLQIQKKIMDNKEDEHIKGDDCPKKVEHSLKRAMNNSDVYNKDESSQDGASERITQKMRQNEIPNIDPINLNLTKSYYILRLIKNRDIKIKLLHTVNYFRAVQRVLANDLREYYTRERAIGDQKDMIGPHYGKDSEGIQFAKRSGPCGPGFIFNTHVNRELDTFETRGDEDNEQHIDPVTLKGYKYNKKFSLETSSTCPCIPKHHRTFGKPNLYEEVSEEVQRKGHPVNNRNEAKSLVHKKDRIIVNATKKDIQVLNEFGIKIIYSESLNDMIDLEEEMIKIGSYFIGRHEFLQTNTDIGPASERPTSMIDRAQVAKDLYEKEFEYQFQKVQLIEIMLQCYEQIYDPLESVRVLQIIVDVMAQRPRLNMEATNFMDSYDAETNVLKEKWTLYREFIELQKQIEETENEEIYKFQELKFRKVTDHILKAWEMAPYPDKVDRQGSDEQQPDNIKMTETIKENMRAKMMKDTQRKIALTEISQRHITEFANEQFTDFANVLGLPEVTVEELYKKQDQKEPAITDCLRERAFFSKQIEGYPTFFSRNKEHGSTLGLHMEKIGLTDFYESFSMISRINAVLAQVFEEMLHVLVPENGYAIANLELRFLKEAKKKIGILRGHYEENEVHLTKSKNHIEQDFFLSNSDKVVFAMREFKADLNPENLYKRANPLVVAKLDVASVANYNFPRIKFQDVVENMRNSGQMNQDQNSNNNNNSKNTNYLNQKEFLSEEIDNNEIVARMIVMAKDSVARQLVKLEEDPADQVDSSYMNDKQFSGQISKSVNAPSMLIMACNMIEVLRLREELIMRVHETDILSQIYMQQIKACGKDDVKLLQSNQINFNTQQILMDNMNYVDHNEGSNIAFDLPFKEFDQTLSANLDFKSESCIKALMTDLGLEELRAVLHYQIMQQHLLIVAVMNNQLILDGVQRALKELELIDTNKKITVPNPILNLKIVLSQNTDGHNFDAIKSERERFKQNLCKDAKDCLYWINPKKAKSRPNILKRFTNTSQKLQGTMMKPETKLRVLRSYRLSLLHNYCKDVLKEVYSDSLKIQTLQTCNDLRIRAQLFPEESKLFTLGAGQIIENLTRDFSPIKEEFSSKKQPKHSLEHLLDGSFTDMFYIPSSDEIVMCERTKNNEDSLAKKASHILADNLDDKTLDQDLKKLVKKPIMTEPTYKSEGKFRFQFRKVNFEESYQFKDNHQYHLLMYTTHMLRILNLEYYMGRNNSPADQILELESKILTGRTFWNTSKSVSYADNMDDSMQYNDQSVSEIVIQRITERKRARLDLQEDISQISYRMKKLNKWFSMIKIENMNLIYFIDLLNLHHQNCFYHFVNGLESILDTYLAKRHDEYFEKTFSVLSSLLKTQHGIQILRNGYYITQAGISAAHIKPDSSQDKEFEQFEQAYQPIIDEQELMPAEIRIVKRLYGHQSNLDYYSKDCYLNFFNLHYASLQSSFFNIDDKERSYIGTSFSQLDEGIKDYLIFMGLKEGQMIANSEKKSKDESSIESSKDKDKKKASTNGEPEKKVAKPIEGEAMAVLKAKVAYLTLKVESFHLQHVMMSWLSCAPVPMQTSEYDELARKFSTHTITRVMEEREKLNEQYWLSKQPKGDQKTNIYGHQQQQMDGLSALGRRNILENVDKRSKEYMFFDKVNNLRAEAILIKRLLEVKLIKMATSMINAEDRAITATFEQEASEKLVHQFVHPQQHFASTLFQSVDRYPHLDVVSKLEFVQQFLTRLRNRCTEVETLTSGPGIVFSIKDFNECLQIFCKSLLKSSEMELRLRVEQQFQRQQQYQHLLYLKEMESLYYKRKCEQFLTEIDTIINAKMSFKGSQIIYELDVASRELRLLKDHYFLMEKLMRKEVMLQFQRKLHEKDNVILLQKDNFQNYKTELNNEVKEEIGREMSNLQANVTSMKNQDRDYMANGFIKQGISGMDQGNKASNERQYDLESMQEVLSLGRILRKQKQWYLFKQVIVEEKHQRELKKQQEQLTQNGALWEQLAEAEKREQITRQELEMTKRGLASYEKLIEKLYGQLEHLNNQRLHLQQYKSNKSKRIDELENKMKDLEILENIDLNKILDELRQRDKSLAKLTKVDKDFNAKMSQQERAYQKQINDLQKKLDQEKAAKNEAFEKLESMRLEMKALEGKDIKSDLWKDKCKELYGICQDLENENSDLKESMAACQKQLEVAISQNQQIQQQSLDQIRFTATDDQAKSYRDNILVNQGGNFKPQTADQSIRERNTRVMSGATKATSVGIVSRRHQERGMTAASHQQLYDRNIQSNISLPGISHENDNIRSRAHKGQKMSNQPNKSNYGRMYATGTGKFTKGSVDMNKPRTAAGFGRFHPQQQHQMTKDSSGGLMSEQAGFQLNGGVLGGNIIQGHNPGLRNSAMPPKSTKQSSKVSMTMNTQARYAANTNYGGGADSTDLSSQAFGTRQNLMTHDMKKLVNQGSHTNTQKS